MSILRSGTFRLYGYSLSSLSGDWTLIGTNQWRWQWNSGGPESLLAFSAPTLLDTTLDGTGLSAGAPPPGFTPTFAAVDAGLTINAYPFPGGNNPGRTRIAGETVFWDAATPVPGGAPTLPAPPFLLYLSLISGITDIRVTSINLAAGDVVASLANIEVVGDYDIVAYWWIIPPLSDCADEQVSHLQLVEATEADPGPPWQRLDPLDDDAAPVPTIVSVTPNHGPIAGGTPLVIDGSGFGDGCVLTIDGVPVTCVVESQFRITCLAPAHAAGAVPVVVTNEDGVVSV